MAGRQPLSARNAQPPRSSAKSKKERYKLLNRQALVETLRGLFSGVSPAVSICEEDLLHPTVRTTALDCYSISYLEIIQLQPSAIDLGGGEAGGVCQRL